MEKSYVDKLAALKSLALRLSNTSPDFFYRTEYILTRSFIYFFVVLNYMFMFAVRQNDNNLESSVVKQELEFPN